MARHGAGLSRLHHVSPMPWWGRFWISWRPVLTRRTRLWCSGPTTAGTWGEAPCAQIDALAAFDACTAHRCRAVHQSRTDRRGVQPVSLLDLVSNTLTDLCGLPANRANEGHEPQAAAGKSAALRMTPVVTTYWPGNHSVRDERWRYTRYNDGPKNCSTRSADRNEFHNLAGNPDILVSEAAAGAGPCRRTARSPPRNDRRTISITRLTVIN